MFPLSPPGVSCLGGSLGIHAWREADSYWGKTLRCFIWAPSLDALFCCALKEDQHRHPLLWKRPSCNCPIFEGTIGLWVLTWETKRRNRHLGRHIHVGIPGIFSRLRLFLGLPKMAQQFFFFTANNRNIFLWRAPLLLWVVRKAPHKKTPPFWRVSPPPMKDTSVLWCILLGC